MPVKDKFKKSKKDIWTFVTDEYNVEKDKKRSRNLMHKKMK